MTTVEQAQDLSFRQRVVAARARMRHVYAPLSVGWRDTKETLGHQMGRLRERFARSRPLTKFLVYGALAFFVLSLPLLPFVSAFYKTVLVDRVAFYVLLALGLNVVVGFAGLLDLGYVAFYAIGAYVAALLTGGVGGWTPPFLIDPFLALPVAVAVCMLAGVLLGLPTLRLRGDYLAIVTLGFHEIVRLTLKNSDPITNGDRGIRAIPHFELPLARTINYTIVLIILGVIIALIGALLLRRGREIRSLAVTLVGVGAVVAALSPVIDEPVQRFGQRFADFGLKPEPYYYLAVVISFLMIFIVHRLNNSRVGRAWVAIREDEIAAEAMGVPTLKFKVWAFAIGASTAGFAGVMLAVKTSFINPQYFILLQSIIVLAMVVFGGMGSIAGAIAGAVFIGLSQEALRDFDVLPIGPILITIGALIAIVGGLVAARVIRTRGGRAYGYWLLGIGVIIAATSPFLEIPFDRIAQRPEDWRLFILGVIITLVMVLRPEGLIPSRRRAGELRGETTAAGEQLATAGSDETSGETLAEREP